MKMERRKEVGLMVDAPNRIKALRKAAGLTQKQLAERVGLSEPAIRMYELGKREPGEDVIKRIGEALDVAPESLRSIEIESAREALELLFALDEKYGLTPHVDENSISLVLDARKTVASQKFVYAIQAWDSKERELAEGSISQEEFDAWKASFKG